MNATTVYMCMSVRGAIRNLQSQRSKHTGFQHDDGRPMTKAEAINALMDELAKGREVIPMKPKCGSPCSVSSKCPGFNYAADMGGCPGFQGEP